MLNDRTILVTGGTGSFGKKFTKRLFEKYAPKKLIIFSRDEYKQYVMRNSFKEHDESIRYFIGDVRDKERMYRAFEGVDYVVHAAALKQVPACEYNPFEAVKTNILGAKNVIDVAIDKEVSKVVALSTDKAVNPINLYGATKMASDKMFISANAYTGGKNTSLSVVRYGNVAGSRGSVIPFFKMLLDKKDTCLPITDYSMTRFWITLDEAVDLVFKALDESRGGETYISKIPSFKVTDLAKAMNPSGTMKEVGIREGEKVHEAMVTEYDSVLTREYDDHYIIYPHFDWWDEEAHMTPGGRNVEPSFRYSSDNNSQWLSVDQIASHLESLEIAY
jgi:UDP-N-acetylglucosamine 4,6-dehydratase/5-epimerase